MPDESKSKNPFPATEQEKGKITRLSIADLARLRGLAPPSDLTLKLDLLGLDLNL